MTSASETAYLTIRELIVRGKLRAGELLVADDLAKLCGVSRTPVREAILRLQAEMFAARLDNKRTIVRPWSADEIEDFIELRVRLAGYTAARAARRITDQQLAKLKDINARMTGMLTSNYDTEQFSEIGGEFYDLLIDIAASERLQQISWHILNPGPLLRSLEHYSPQDDAELVKDHHDLILAVEARDPVWAEAAMTVHIRKTYRLKIAPQSA
jgi:DNA-binding GntR family transcriptional regulator